MEFKLADSTKKYLLREARRSVSGFLGVDLGEEAQLPPEETGALRGVFVTLRKNGRLRGCVGVMEAKDPLREAVYRMARAAAFEDGRFPPVTAGELADIDMEITVLSPMEPVTPENVVAGRDGLYMEYTGRRGVLLPQVPSEMGWGREEFLDNLCVKAGVPAGTWRNDNITLFRFDGIIFSERDFLLTDNQM